VTLQIFPSEPGDDIALMARVVSGDRVASQAVVQRLQARVQRISRALLRNDSDAKDASQLSLVEILRSAHTFRGESSLERWTDRIAQRTTLRWAASERRKRGTQLFPECEPTTSPHGGSQVFASECLNALSEPQRTALLLRCGFEYSVEEIAELTAVSPNTVKDRLQRSRAILRPLLQQGSLTDLTAAGA
jgi:RNA polymerase sigma-70 factor, ECF subfamily